ncbi:MAG: PAS domain-containing protein [Parvibaculaceae bacterium]|nr:PAS domain-containing protein [Parvibaculaceae bacterium]
MTELRKLAIVDSDVEALLNSTDMSSLVNLGPVSFKAIEADVLRQVLAYWQEMRMGAEMPLMKNLDPVKMGRWLSHITIIEVQRDPLAFVYRLTGEKLELAHGSGIKGSDVRAVNASVPGLGDILHLMYKQLMGYKKPVALRGDLVMENPGLKGMELLILPVSLEGEKVDRLLNVAYYYEHSLMPAGTSRLARR